MNERLNPEYYGAAPLLGVTGQILVGHGRSRRKAVENSLDLAMKLSNKAIPDNIDKFLCERIQG
jgi:glycerol-3-phosphate acyltransferase PlsX